MGISKGELQAKIVDAFEQRKKERLEANPEYQKRKYQMTREDRCREAKERTVRNIYTQGQKDGSHCSYSDAEKRAEKIVDRFVREVEK